MGLTELLIGLVVIGVILALVPIDRTIRDLILILVIIAVLVILAKGFGLIGSYRHWTF